MKDPISRNITIAGMFKYAAWYSMIFYMPVYFQKVFPIFQTEFATINALSLSILGFISSVSGSLIIDRYQKKFPNIMSNVCSISSLLAFPFSIICFLATKNFWLSISCLSLQFLLGETWFSPAMTML